MQFLYANDLSKINSSIVEKNMLHSIDKIEDLYLCLLNLLLSLGKMAKNHLESMEKKQIDSPLYNHNLFNLSSNKLLEILSSNESLKTHNVKNRALLWNPCENYLHIFFNQSKNFSFLEFGKKNNLKKDFNFDKKFILEFYRNYLSIHPDLEKWASGKYFTWEEDLKIAHHMVINTLNFMKESSTKNYELYKFYKNKEDKDFILELFRQTLFYKLQFNDYINKASLIWKINRIDTLDLIILQMALCEFLYFPAIPIRVSMNEYIEIAKVYAGENSKRFVNGILNELFKNLNKENKIDKVGRGLI